MFCEDKNLHKLELNELELNELASLVFSERYKFIKGPKKIRGKSGKNWTFDAIVQNGGFEQFGVFIRDWKREISIIQLRQLHKACVDTMVQGGIMICNFVTDFSLDYCSQFGIQLLSRGALISTLRNREYEF